MQLDNFKICWTREDYLHFKIETFAPSRRAAADQEIPNSICCFFHLVSFPFHVCLLESLCGLAAFLWASGDGTARRRRATLAETHSKHTHAHTPMHRNRKRQTAGHPGHTQGIPGTQSPARSHTQWSLNMPAALFLGDSLPLWERLQRWPAASLMYATYTIN